MFIKDYIVEAINMRLESLKQKNERDEIEYKEAEQKRVPSSYLESLVRKIVPTVEEYYDTSRELDYYKSLIRETTIAYNNLEMDPRNEELISLYRLCYKRLLFLQDRLSNKYCKEIGVTLALK